MNMRWKRMFFSCPFNFTLCFIWFATFLLMLLISFEKFIFLKKNSWKFGAKKSQKQSADREKNSLYVKTKHSSTKRVVVPPFFYCSEKENNSRICAFFLSSHHCFCSVSHSLCLYESCVHMRTHCLYVRFIVLIWEKQAAKPLNNCVSTMFNWEHKRELAEQW